MKFGKLDEITGDAVRKAHATLWTEGNGCWAVCFATDSKYNYAVCIGWHDTGSSPARRGGWKIAWKIGRQTTNNVMQCDFDVDFDLPYDPKTGDVDDTLETIEVMGGRPVGHRSWAALATRMRKTARRVWKDWKEVEDE